MVIENDLVQRRRRSRTSASTGSPATYRSNTFLTVTNHDRALDSVLDSARWEDILREHGFKDDDVRIGVAWKIMESSVQRKACVERLYQECVANGFDPTSPATSNDHPVQSPRDVEFEDIKIWLRTYPLRNETTHFSCIMDPSAPDGGAMVWVEACEEV